METKNSGKPFNASRKRFCFQSNKKTQKSKKNPCHPLHTAQFNEAQEQQSMETRLQKSPKMDLLILPTLTCPGVTIVG